MAEWDAKTAGFETLLGCPWASEQQQGGRGRADGGEQARENRRERKGKQEEVVALTDKQRLDLRLGHAGEPFPFMDDAPRLGLDAE